ncbi:MAG: hypothetical protein AB8B57_14585 [Congregibacter sp.]
MLYLNCLARIAPLLWCNLLILSSLNVQAVEELATLNFKLLPEASGIAVSRLNPDRIWFVNDSGNRPQLVALDYVEGHYSTVLLRGIRNRDWEDLASFSYRGESWLAVADVGDNNGRRKEVYVYLLPEPKPGERRVSVQTKIVITYPDGPRDVESIAIDSERQILYLLSKRDKKPRLYRVLLPELHTTAKLERVAEKLGEVTSIPPPSPEILALYPKYGKYRSQPTGMALMPDGSAIAVMTYGGAFLATITDDQGWLESLNTSLCRVATPQLTQSETIAADSLGRLYISSEGESAPLLRMSAHCAP